MKVVIFQEPQTAEQLIHYSAVINVADSPCALFDSPVPQYWFPIHEVGYWGYEPFYGAAKVIDHYIEKEVKRPILIHCHAGVLRSPCVAYAIGESFYATGREFEYGYLGGIFHETQEKTRNHIKEIFDQKTTEGFIPPGVVDFLTKRFKWPHYSVAGLLEKAKLFNGSIPEKFVKMRQTQIKDAQNKKVVDASNVL